MTDEEQRDIVLRGATTMVCAAAMTVTLPMIGEIQDGKRQEAEYRFQAQMLAQMQDGGATVRTADHAPALLNSPWLRTVEYTLERDTDSSMSRYAMRDRDGAALRSLVSFKPEHVQRAETINAEHMCLAQAVYYESAHEPLAGQLAVAEVITNRMRDHRYPDTACGVVYQGATRTTGCQFTFTCDGALARKPVGEGWARAQKIASHVLMNLNEKRTGGATHYHATYVDPIWNAGLIKTDKIGLHIFYRFPRGAEWQTVRQDFSTGRRAKVVKASAPVQTVPSTGNANDLNTQALAVLTEATPTTAPNRTVTRTIVRRTVTQQAAPASETSATTTASAPTITSTLP